MKYGRFCLPVILLMLIGAPVSHAVLRGSELPPPTAPSYPHYTAGFEAFKRQDWQGVIEHMTQAIKRRPWSDNAYNAIGYAYRQLGNYPSAITHYQQALHLNPHHRGALEYLGETYLLMGCVTKAQHILATLESVCKRVTGASDMVHWQEHCEEWKELKAVIDSTRHADRTGCNID